MLYNQNRKFRKNIGGMSMNTGTILKSLRESRHLTQEELAERLMVTRQAV
ncbi:MAG: helix-turn-helix transcriptional regulator, partial [Lachnospiraceae bacterium]|nr:helix-turn-helix transcriptional regulator [Lachnospiraceae bacterium]